MPSYNPLVSHEDVNGSTLFASPVVQQATIPSVGYGGGSPGGEAPVNPMAAPPNVVNASGSSENVAMHIAILVAVALIGVYVFRASGFRFVVAGGLGG